jgi:E3 ubiquitin-protein ligase BRE1
MTISTPLQPSHPSFIKMEDRKRSAGDDLAPPTKRQAVNGKASADADMPWASDLEVCHCHRHRCHHIHQHETSWIHPSLLSARYQRHTPCISLCMIYWAGANAQLAVRSMLLSLQTSPSLLRTFPPIPPYISSRSSRTADTECRADVCRVIEIPERRYLSPNA